MVMRDGRPSLPQRQLSIIWRVAFLFKRGLNQNTLEPEHVEQIFAWYRDYANVASVARVATLDEIAQNDWNLNISRYVEPTAEVETLTVEQALANLKQSLGQAYAAEERLAKLLKEAQFGEF